MRDVADPLAGSYYVEWLTDRMEQEAWKLFIKAYPNLDDELNRQAWIDTLPRFAKRPAALDKGRYQRFGAFMAEAGLIDAAPGGAELAGESRGDFVLHSLLDLLAVADRARRATSNPTYAVTPSLGQLDRSGSAGRLPG